jgi:hypothetical protein
MNTTEQALEYRIRRLSDDNIADAEQLHAAVYGIKLRPGFFSAKYNTAFAGIQHVGFMAYHRNGMPIAFYAVIPCFIGVNEAQILAGQSADTMTHPYYRFKGLFVELATRTFELCRSLGIRLAFGFPNQNSLPGFINKLGWQTTERMDCFRIQVAVKPLPKVLSKVSLLKNAAEARRKNVLKKNVLNQLGVANSVVDDGFGGICRTDGFLRYKTYNKSYVVRIENSMVWLKINNVLLIGDMLMREGEFGITINGLKKLASRLGLNELQFHASPGTTLHRLFLTVCQPIPSFPIIFKDLGAGIHLEQIKFTSADIDTF